MTTILTILLLSQAGFAIRETHEPRTPPRPCDQAKVDACIAQHGAARAAELSVVASLDEKIGALSRESQSIRERAVVVDHELRALTVTKSMAEAEIGTESLRSSRAGEEVFPGGPAPAGIRLLGAGSPEWGEEFPAERRERLKELVGHILPRVADLEPVQRKLAMEISDLEKELAPYRPARDQASVNADRHAYMCNSGCLSQICPQL